MTSNILLWLEIFVLGFIVEIFICLYTKSVAERKIGLATTTTALLAFLSCLSVNTYVHTPILIIPYAVGQTLATYLVLRFMK